MLLMDRARECSRETPCLLNERTRDIASRAPQVGDKTRGSDVRRGPRLSSSKHVGRRLAGENTHIRVVFVAASLTQTMLLVDSRFSGAGKVLRVAIFSRSA